MSAQQIPEPIAIVGSSCRFPGGSNTPSALWDLLKAPRDVGKKIPDDRFNPDGFHHPDGTHHGAANVKRSYLIDEDIRAFDAAFFNISPNEAESMDPQQRLLLETVYEALESGGHTIDGLRGSNTAVYAGTMTADYNDTGMRDLNVVPTYLATGVNRCIISNRVSYFFDWHGPSMTIDTACSSSLIAVHQGVTALRTGESRVALACGTQVILNPEMYIMESKLKMLSSFGESRMWDASAGGYARGEGVGALVLKKLSDAIADGDHIECLIRETGTNQDGHSNGITVPNPDAQEALIRQTYARAGLDPVNNPQDRPQYFEAHGTGTKAGDPKEAAAIYAAFGQYKGANEDPLYVGSIKTVIGHLEGAAGLAGLLKGKESIENGFIAPNLLFKNLNPDIEPFYKGIRVPTELTPWPKLEDGTPRRVSVNSFGFGGSNAHCILEQYIPSEPKETKAITQSDSVFTPFVFSAQTEQSLVAQLKALSEHFKNNKDISASDLSYTLQARRSQFPVRATYSATTLEALVTKIDAKLAPLVGNPNIAIGTRVNAKAGSTPKILGVFTGQGAQWSAMGAQLIRTSAYASKMIDILQDSLDSLPAADRPSWKIREQLLAPEGESRLGEAALSQPLCTVVQVILVDLLHAAGVKFSAVVGHSSGEIGAAYAAGFFSATDALRIAYYRGVHAKLAGNPSTGQKGAMMAVGTSWEDSEALINLETFKGRIAIAAHNSAASVTLSGDADAVVAAKKVFDEDKKFARLLKVDTAYHSHHMLPCGDAYVESLRACGVKVLDRKDTSCQWFSSVTPSSTPMDKSEGLKDVYWKDNMCNAVLFTEAVVNAISSDEQLAVGLEVGPHPALKGPAAQSISEVRPNPIPYSGVLSRGANDVEALSDALGFLWTQLGTKAIDFQAFNAKISGQELQSTLVRGMPRYQWNHATKFWNESRRSRRIRGPKPDMHEVLGVLLPESNPLDLRWSNVLKASEISWLEGHRLQGQSVFPGSGYVAMAIEASKHLAGDKKVELFELNDFTIPRALAFDEDDKSGVETQVTLTEVKYQNDETATAQFNVYSTPVVGTGSELELDLVASGSVRIVFGEPSPDALSAAPLSQLNMGPVDMDRFYNTLDTIGYGYSGPFKSLSSIMRKLDQASGQVASYPYSETDTTRYLVHPSTLDVAFHAGIAAFSAPGDERLWSLHVPTGIRSIRVNPEVCNSLTSGGKVPVAARCDSGEGAFSAYIDIMSEDGQKCMLQVEELTLKPFAPGAEGDDRVFFTSTHYGTAAPNGADVTEGVRPTASEVELAQACDRIALFYLRKWGADLTEQQWANGETHYKHLRSWVTKTLDQAKKGAAGIKREWNEDGKDEIDALVAKFSDSLDVQMIVTVGEKLPAAVRGEVSLEEHLALDNKLEEYKQTGLGVERYNKFLGAITKQITYRYPHMNILEVGAGSGAATQHVLNQIGGKMRSYTYTDASADSFTQAAQEFKKYSDKMSFKTLDLSQEPSAQGYTEGAYDLVIASDSIHATQSLNTTLANARKLLRPGGYLLLAEITNNEPVRTGFVRGSLAGWWQGVDDGRKLAPTVTPGIWHSSLRKAGFSGVDVTTPVIDSTTWPFSVMAAQAIDDRVKFLRQPLSGKSPISIDNLVICGNKGLTTACLAEELSDHLERFCGDLMVLEDLPTKDDVLDIPPMSTFIILADLDSPIFKDFGEEQMEGLQAIMELANHVLWITSGALIENPHHMGSIAFGRVVRREATHISLNHLDVSDIEKPGVSNIIATHLLQSYAVEEWENDEQTQVLWSKEPEAFVENGKLVIPRLMSQVDQNARINSNRRTIMKELPIASTNATLVPRSESSPLSLVEPAVNLQVSSAVVARVDGSTQMALGVAADTFLFVAADEKSVFLSTTNSKEMAPIATIPAEGAVDQTRLIIAVASELLAESLLQPISSGSHLMVHCSITDRFLTAALSRQASAKNVKVTFTTDAKEKQISDSSWIKFSSRESLFTTKKTLAKAQLTHFLDLTAGTSDISLRLAHTLPSNCQQIYTASIVREASNLPSQFDVKALETRLQSAYSQAQQYGVLAEEKVEDLVVCVDNLSQAIAGHTTGAVHWPSEGSVKVNVRYVQGNGLFSKEKSYLLVGLSGKIGQSLAEWMVSSGAGCVVLTSRRPKVDEEWLNSFKGTGSVVKVASMDATDMRSVENAIKEIRATCPPIGGVANGAMVLHDTLFSKMSTEKMQQALAPKIEGSYNLDQAFFNDDLDFFVFFSSVACVMGNVGQSNYAAANAYQTSLARQRRRRGLAASAFDIGQVVGVGYVETADQAVIDQLAALGGMSVSETDLRHALAETIIVGRPNPKDMTATPYAEVTTGIRHYLEDENVQGPWFTNAYFSHVVLDNTSSGDDSKDKDKKSNIPAAKQLQKASTKEEAFNILKDCFAKKLAVILQLGDAAIDYDAPLADLGIDSLVAVEVRSWFLKEVKVDVPVLKVVGGATLTELCDLAYKKLPEDLLSGIGKAPVEEKAKPISPKAQLAAPSSSGSDTASETNSVRGADTPATTDLSTTDSVPDAKRVESSLRVASSKVSAKLNPSPQQTTTERPQKATTVSGTQRPRRYVKSVPLSLAQSRFWFLHQLLADQRTHNVGYYYHIKGDLNVADMERAVRVVSSRHEALRTCFIPDEVDHSKAYQKVLPSSPVRLICKNISSKEDMLSEYEELKKHDFDMASGELLRLVLLTASPSSHYLLVFYHHIVMDGISFQVFLADLEKAYNGESLGAAPRQYPEFSVAQHKAIENGEMQPHLDYWRSIFPEGTQPPVLPLMPMARTNARVPMGVFDTHQVITYLGADVTARVRALAKAQRSTPFHLYLAAFKTILFAFTNADDLTIGVADGARNDGGVMNSIGFFLNLLTLRFRRDEGQSFNDAITDARQTSHAALEHSPLPFDVLLNELGIERSSKHSPFFQAFIDYRQGLQAFQPFGNCQLEMSPDIHTGKTAYDITVDVTETEEESVIMVRGQKSIYDLTATQLFADTFAHFVDVLTATPSLVLPEIPMFSQKQLTDAVTIGRGPKLVSDWPETLPRRIDQVAESNQDKVALLDDSGKDLTYREMIDRIEAIAEALQNAGVGPEKRVPVFEQATADWPCSMLAIMRLGAIYVPLDLRNPVSRLAAVAKDCDAHAVLVDSTTVGDAPGLEVPSATIINVNDLGRKASASIPNQSRADSPAAILYTSGSTGTPKGIMVTHAGLRNEIEGYTKMWKLGAERALQQSAFTFNHSSDQMYTGLVNGGSVYMVPWEKRGNPLEITQIMKDFSITYTKATPAEYSLWMQYGGDALKSATSWRHAFGGGESLTTSVTQEFANLGLTNLRMLNSYGPTEISISSTKMEIDYRDTESLERMGRIPCGFSLPNYFMYAVDEQMNPMPAGMPGQLAIGGAGVSLGYLKNKELTDKHFVHNPFANEEDVANGWTRMYLTGDIGHLNPDGAMVFRSRVSGDTQVKIRGLRIELADIESNIVACSGGVVREAVVTLREGDPEFLVSHVVFNPQQAAAIADKETFLQQLLNNLEVPQYMVPVAAIPLDQFPLTKHNKVDRKLLKTMPLPERVGATAETEEEDLEMTEMMVQVKKLWKDVLGKGIESLGMAINPSTSFFAAGGNSLLIIRLQSRIRQELDISIPLVDLLGAKTLAQMTRKIEESASVKAIDWTEETATPAIPSFLEGVSGSVAQTGKTVLITGATGFLAKYLLPQLDARADVDTIHCVAVRDTEKLFSSPKIVSHSGDLTSPLLGLSEEVFRELSSKADVILHLGAARSFWDSYHVLRSTNVLPTKEVVKLAAPRQIPIHYISTGDVFKGSAPGPTSAAEHLPPTDGSSGYTASRWASERILERATDIGVPSSIYRLLPASKNTGAVADVQKELLRCADVTGALPENSGWAGRIDVLPTDAVIAQLFKGMLDESVSGKTLFQNMESHVMVDGPELVSCLEEHRANRPDLETCPMLRWFGRVKEAGFTYFLASYDATLESSDVKLQMAR